MINFRLLSTKSSQIFLNLVFFLFSWRTWLSLICRKNDNIFQRTEYTAERTRELVPWSKRCPNRKGYLRDVDVFRGLSFGISIYIFHLHRVLHCTTKGNFGHISLNVSIKSSHKTARKRIVAKRNSQIANRMRALDIATFGYAENLRGKHLPAF